MSESGVRVTRQHARPLPNDAQRSPMRIAVWHNLPSGGGKRALYDQVRRLVARGHHVEAWCPPTADRSYLPLVDLIAEHVVALDLRAKNSRRALGRLGLQHAVPGVVGAMAEHAAEVVAAMGQNFDVLFAAPCQLLAVPLVGTASPLPSVLYLQEPNRVLYEAGFRPDFARHECQPTLPWLGSRHEARRAAYLGRSERRAIAAFDRVLVNSYFTRESVLRAYGVASHVSYLGVDVARFAAAPAPEANHFVGVGAFVPEKRIELALAAVARSGVSAPLIWIGNHVYSDAYMNRLCRAAHEVGVEFIPHLMASEADLIRLVSSARAMVYAPRLEPFGLGPLEANACGVAVAAGAEGGVRETVVDGMNGLLVEPRPEHLGDALARLADNSAFARDMRMRARDYVTRHWGIEPSIDRLERHLVEVAASGA